jgi:hypothetical protein
MEVSPLFLPVGKNCTDGVLSFLPVKKPHSNFSDFQLRSAGKIPLRLLVVVLT